MKYLFTILMLSINFSVSAQIPLDSFYQQGTTWCGYEYYGGTIHSVPTTPFIFRITGDTLLNNKNYRIVRANISNAKALGAIRTDSTKVYYYKLDSTTYSTIYGHSRAFAALPYMQEAILYDFDLKVGDTVAWKPAGNKTVIDIQQVQLSDGRIVNKYLFENTVYDYWIYGIGSCQGLFGSLFYFPPADLQTYMGQGFHYNFPIVQSIDIASCFPLSIEKEQTHTTVKRVYPNPLIGDLLNIETDVDVTGMTVCDMQGRICYTHAGIIGKGISIVKLPINAGLYFITLMDKEGKKMFVKLEKE